MLDAILTIRTVIHRKYSTAGFFVPSLLYVYVGNNIDIYAGMEGRSAAASAAYARARDWYQKAMASFESDSLEYKSAAAELAEVPTAK